ncbi:hypothetical protein M6D81_11635 [Paenibacillus sp. J5C_2022]|uniref:hypothetical protein n=1 Tax=Paenibacillus sp. J5C2022 TaxID=2977129 RepID=UPI0021D07E66|nr:hypothetical protein [Paenibacillus sp. J5C2022]MCU6709359.1 hypothetical protein [Paenibacillus sp. J5C2022]
MTTEIGAIKARIEFDISQAQRHIDKVKRDMLMLKTGADKTATSFRGLESALIAVGASASLVGLTRVVKSLADEANQLAMSMQGLVEISKALNVNIEESTKLAEDLASRGFMSIAEASNAVKTALSAGLNLEQARDLINATADAAAYNREAHLGWGEAVVQVMRGIKSGNSELTDAAGITTNLSVMYDRYAKTIGTTAAKLTEAQKVQAAYTEIMKEAELFTGNADKALEGYAGTQAQFNQTLTMARAELGEAFLPVLKELMETLTPIIVDFTKWAEENKEVIAGLSAATVTIGGLVAAFTTLITVMGAARAAAIALNLSLGPIGWAMALIGTAAAGFMAYSAAADAASESALKFAGSQAELNEKLAGSSTDRTLDDIKAMQSDIEVLNGILDERNKLMDEYNQREKEAHAGRGSIENTHALFELADAVKEVDRGLKEMGYTAETAEQAVDKMNAAIEESSSALKELRMEELREIAAKQDQAAESERLIDRYSELTTQTKRSKDENDELTQTVRKLSERYPELAVELDKQGSLLITNESLVRDLIAAEKDASAVLLTEQRKRTEIRAKEAKEALNLAKSHLKALSAVAGGKVEAAPFLTDQTADFLGRQGQKAASDVLVSGQVQADVAGQEKRLNELELELAAIENGTWRELIKDDKPVKPSDNPGSGGGKGGAKSSGPSAEQLAQEAYRAALQLMEKRRLLGQLTEQQEADTLARLAKQYEKYDDIWIDAESRRQRVVDQMAADQQRSAEERARQSEAEQRKSYDKSAEWIEMETRRMTEKGESEEAIARMTLEAWTRVRNRYGADTDYYKRADKAMFDARMELRRMDEAAAKQAAETAEKAQRDLTKSVLDNIDKQRKAELDALDKRKKATQKYYDDLLRIIDESERGRERKKVEEEAEKYRFATSEQGRKRYEELQEQLRKMDVEDNKRALEQERDDKLDALDRQKDDIDAWYSDLKAAADSFNGDMITMYQLTEDARLNAFVTTNAEILAEMERFKSEMDSLQAGSISGQASADPYKSSILTQMQANAKAWHTADAAGRERLKSENQRLGAEIGAAYDGRTGKWLGADGIPLFHSGGIVGQRTFNAGDMLMPDEVTAILREGEVVLTPGQIRSLLEGVGGRGGTNVNIERIVGVEMNDTTLEDEIDVRAIGRTGVDMAAEIARNQYTGTSGGGGI